MDESSPVSAGATAAPALLEVEELHSAPLARLVERVAELGLRLHPERTRHQIIFDLLRSYAERGTIVTARGVVEIASENHAFIRWPSQNFRPGPEDPYFSAALLKRHGIQN